MPVGYRPAGWYGYDWIDNDGIPSAEQILPEWQHVEVGETVPIWRGVNSRVTTIEPDKYFVFASESGTDRMAIGLYPLEEDGCVHRILDRVAGAGGAASVDGPAEPAGSCRAGVASISIVGNNRKSEGNHGMM